MRNPEDLRKLQSHNQYIYIYQYIICPAHIPYRAGEEICSCRCTSNFQARQGIILTWKTVGALVHDFIGMKEIYAKPN